MSTDLISGITNKWIYVTPGASPWPLLSTGHRSSSWQTNGIIYACQTDLNCIANYPSFKKHATQIRTSLANVNLYFKKGATDIVRLRPTTSAGKSGENQFLTLQADGTSYKSLRWYAGRKLPGKLTGVPKTPVATTGALLYADPASEGRSTGRWLRLYMGQQLV